MECLHKTLFHLPLPPNDKTRIKFCKCHNLRLHLKNVLEKHTNIAHKSDIPNIDYIINKILKNNNQNKP
jgi:hypothetical protein